MTGSKPQSIYEVLDAVDRHMDSEKKWTKGAYARSAEGHKVLETSTVAVCYCLAGAIIFIASDENHPGIANKIGNETLVFLGNLLREQAPVAIHEWNDDAKRTFDDVKACLAMAKKKAVEAGLNVPVPGATESTYMNP